MRFTSTITDADTRPDLLDIDPAAPGYGTHLPFYGILARCGVAWRAYLQTLGGFDDGVIVPHLSVDFAAEVLLGTIDVDVRVTHVGTTSFTLSCTVLQNEREAARVSVVLVSFDYSAGKPVRLTAVQRGQLENQLNSDSKNDGERLLSEHK